MISVDIDKLEYPIIIEVPEEYWTSSHDVEYAIDE